MRKSTMIKAALAATALVCSLALSACETNTEQHAYNFGIHDFSGNIGGLAIVEPYLNERGCIMGNRIYTGSSVADCNAQAQADLTASVAKIDSFDLGMRLASVTTISFTYTCKGNGFTGTGFAFSKP